MFAKMRNKNQLAKEIIYNFMLFDDFALQPAYEHLLEGKKGALLRILYSENIEKRKIRETCSHTDYTDITDLFQSKPPKHFCSGRDYVSDAVAVCFSS